MEVGRYSAATCEFNKQNSTRRNIYKSREMPATYHGIQSINTGYAGPMFKRSSITNNNHF
jgi:hypothetical protein